MSTRKANFTTLQELCDEVSPEVVRYFFVMRNINSHLNFELEIAKDQSDANPIFYLQYAHARICSLLTKYMENNAGMPVNAEAIENGEYQHCDKLIHEITKEYNITTIINSHDMNSVIEIGEKIIFLVNGEKNWEGTNKEILKTDVESVKNFVYSSELLKKVKKYL